MGLEEDHYLADLLMIGPGFFDHLKPFSANAIDFSELFNLQFYDVGGLFLEFLDDPLGHDRPDALDKPRPQVLFNASH
jgi:hypothetical protein